MRAGTASFVSAAAFLFVLLPTPVPARPADLPSGVPEITDPRGDARFGVRDHETPVTADSDGDVLRAWFKHDESNLKIYIETAAGPSFTRRLRFRVITNPIRRADLYDYREPPA